MALVTVYTVNQTGVMCHLHFVTRKINKLSYSEDTVDVRGALTYT